MRSVVMPSDSGRVTEIVPSWFACATPPRACATAATLIRIASFKSSHKAFVVSTWTSGATWTRAKMTAIRCTSLSDASAYSAHAGLAFSSLRNNARSVGRREST